VPIAEQAGLMVALSRYVLRTATRDAAAWRVPGHDVPSLHVAVNLSGRHIQDPSLLQDVQEALIASQFDPSLFTIEITESVMMHNTQGAIAVLRELKALGIKIAVDDFGTGYSSLSYLQQFPIDVLKIDKRFIETLGSGTSDDALTRAILSLGDALGLATVAEGIETPRQLSELQAMGCLLGQGYLLSHPLPARVFADQVGSGNLQKNLEHLEFVADALRVA
jgi:EAL domain-containing protein (putative c-di-GMP-specific phosphodiesterase class I)